MTTFAPGTNKDYANAYNNWWFGGGAQSGQKAPQRSSYGPDSQPAGAPKPMNMSAYSPGRAQPIQPPSQGTQYGARPQYETLGGGANDPRWAENGGHWGSRSGQQPQATPMSSLVVPGMGYTQPISSPSSGGVPRVSPRGRYNRPDMGTNLSKKEFETRGAADPAWSQAQSMIPELRQEFPGMNDFALGDLARRRVAQQRNESQRRYQEEANAGSDTAARNRQMDEEMAAANAQSRAALAEKRGGGQSPMATPQWNMQAAPSSGQYGGNLSYAPPDQRPPPFQASYGQIGGGYSDEPNFGQRDAFISQINSRMGRGGPANMDFGKMWSNAGDMVKSGWQNPLMGLFQR